MENIEIFYKFYFDKEIEDEEQKNKIINYPTYYISINYQKEKTKKDIKNILIKNGYDSNYLNYTDLIKFRYLNIIKGNRTKHIDKVRAVLLCFSIL